MHKFSNKELSAIPFPYNVNRTIAKKKSYHEHNVELTLHPAIHHFLWFISEFHWHTTIKMSRKFFFRAQGELWILVILEFASQPKMEDEKLLLK